MCFSYDFSYFCFGIRSCIFAVTKKKNMQKNTKEWIQYGSAVFVLILAIVLVYISYFTSKTQDVPDNVLWYFAQSLMYAGSIFGVIITVDAKFENFKNKFLNHNRDEKD